ncbi:MAG: hypothetical protein HY675_19385 [Chloroflexi bacterium]|nr:hypothetical protein [Chloroflexota bacterium]
MATLADLRLLGMLILAVGGYFTFVANVDQSFPTLLLGWLVTVLSMQMGKAVLK